jgi:hypothetical protein
LRPRLEALSHPFASMMRFMDAYLLLATSGAGMTKKKKEFKHDAEYRGIPLIKKICDYIFLQVPYAALNASKASSGVNADVILTLRISQPIFE